jgi:hypothetical protein
VSPSTPEEALAEARRRAAAARAAGIYDDAEAVAGLGRTPPYEGIDQLYDWAFIEPDRDQVVSTRRLGAPITAVKRGLMRLLRQYHRQMEGEQTRFNVHLLSYIARLEGRVAELEEPRDEKGSS